MRPAISVALATFDGAAHLGEQIDSILAQCGPSDEIVLADDGSTDGSVEIVRDRVAAAVDGPQLVVVDGPPPHAVAANFARALRAARRDIILLSDQDDRWLPTRIDSTLAAFGDDPRVLAVHADARLVDEAGADLGGLFEALEIDQETLADINLGDAYRHLLRRNLTTGATMAVRRQLVDRALPIPSGWIHDEWLALVAAAAGGLRVVDAPLIEYRQHATNEIGARRLGIGGKISRMLEPGAERSARLLTRATSLSARIADVPEATPVQITAARAKLEHEIARSALPRFRPARLIPVIRELRTGRYREFGRGGLDAVRDLVQPLTAVRGGRGSGTPG